MGARILVADDSVTIQKVVELTFSKEDFVLVQARNGEEALRKAKEVRPDLVLLDLVMPDKNGYEVCAALRAEPTLRGVPIILLTGTFEAFDKAQGIRAGADDFVTKPFESQLLVSKVKQLLFSRMLEKGAPAAAPTSGRGAAPRTEGDGSPEVLAAPRGAGAFQLPTAAGGPPPAPARAAVDLSPPTEEISQDHLWQLLDASGPAPSAAGTEVSEVRLEPLTTPTGSIDAGETHADIPLLELDVVGRPAGGAVAGDQGGAAGSGAASPLPESLSLEDLLEAPLPAAAADTAPLLGEAPPAAPVFDLTAGMEAPPLPMSEVAEGESAVLSFADLMDEGAVAEVDEAAPLAEPVLDLGPLPGGVLEEVPPAAADVAAEPLAEEPSIGIPLTPEEVAAIEAGAGPAVEPSAPRGAAPAGPALVEEAPPAAPAAPALTESEVTSLRDAVTARVAHELARDLTEKLVDRMERIVWEVVPDLAEILITKEIERLRAMAQDKKSS